MSEETVEMLYRNMPVFVKRAYKILGNRREAEEAVQDAFAKVWINLEKKKPKQVFKYTHLAVRNMCYDRLRRKRTVSLTDIDPERLAEIPTPALELAVASAINNEVEDLRQDYRDLVIDRYFDKLSYQDIAEKRGISYGTARTKLWRALDELRCKIWANHPEVVSYQVA